MPRSVLEAIKMGLWDFEPPEVEYSSYDCTEAMPGTKAKLEVLAERVRSGLPLWHPQDRDEVPDQRVRAEESARVVDKPR